MKTENKILFSIRKGIFYKKPNTPKKYCAVVEQQIQHQVFVLYYAEPGTSKVDSVGMDVNEMQELSEKDYPELYL